MERPARRTDTEVWMRLAKLTLRGFKSFDDPTEFTFDDAMTGIVGPNGCGKSNVIDAVRWVMGEISAKHLRGDTMADVVFTGSNTRKPVSRRWSSSPSRARAAPR